MAAVAFPLTHERLRPAPRPARPGPAPRPRAARPLSPGTYARRRVAAVIVVAAVVFATVVAAWALLGALGGGPLTAPEPISSRVPTSRVIVVQPGDLPSMQRPLAARTMPFERPRPVGRGDLDDLRSKTKGPPGLGRLEDLSV